jgi:FkbM family methyltransferase
MPTWLDAPRLLVRALLRPRPARQRVRLQFRKSTIWLTVSSEVEQKYRARPSAKEPWTVEWLEQHVHAGDVLYDVGANVGTYSLIGAIRCGARVFAFEPGFSSYARLCENIHLNACQGRIVPLAWLLGDHAGLMELRYRSVEPGQSRHTVTDASPDAPPVPAADYRQPTPMLPLDDAVRLFALPAPNHIKLDVDGAEGSVLRGARQTLRGGQLRSLLVEADTASADEVERLLADAGFRRSAHHVRRKPSAPTYSVFVRVNEGRS